MCRTHTAMALYMPLHFISGRVHRAAVKHVTATIHWSYPKSSASIRPFCHSSTMGQLLSRPNQDQGLPPARPANSVTRSMCDAPRPTDWNLDESLFKYTSGRWLFNEAKQLAKRSLKFDMNQLARLAAESVGSNMCQKVVKLAESDLNKIYLMTTDKGEEIIVKVPHPNAGRPGLNISSEVATMDYVSSYSRLETPKQTSHDQ